MRHASHAATDRGKPRTPNHRLHFRHFLVYSRRSTVFDLLIHRTKCGLRELTFTSGRVGRESHHHHDFNCTTGAVGFLPPPTVPPLPVTLRFHGPAPQSISAPAFPSPRCPRSWPVMKFSAWARQRHGMSVQRLLHCSLQTRGGLLQTQAESKILDCAKDEGLALVGVGAVSWAHCVCSSSGLVSERRERVIVRAASTRPPAPISILVAISIRS